MELSFEDLPADGGLLIRIGNRTTSLVHNAGIEIVRIGFGHFVADVAQCLNASSEQAVDYIKDPSTAPPLLHEVLRARASEFAEHVARVAALLPQKPDSAAISSAFPLPPGLLDEVRGHLQIPCRVR